ncbi:MAG TPA: undecaprenyl-diphosphate phosphatase, partial [Baekduia sp.]
MSPDPPALPLAHAVVLGALHGPAELVPVSSSAHVALVPQLLGWPAAELDDDLRKALEVALHAGTLGALLVLVPWPRPAWA